MIDLILAGIGILLVAGTVIYIAYLTIRTIVNWFKSKYISKNEVKFIFRDKLKNGKVRYAPGLFNTLTEEVTDSQIYEADNAEEKLKELFNDTDLIIDPTT